MSLGLHYRGLSGDSTATYGVHMEPEQRKWLNTSWLCMPPKAGKHLQLDCLFIQIILISSSTYFEKN